MVSTTAPAPKGRGTGRSSLGRIATIAAAILVTLAFLYPVIYMVSISFKLPKDIFTVPLSGSARSPSTTTSATSTRPASCLA
jgi:multiple sugar transport system permease protein